MKRVISIAVAAALLTAACGDDEGVGTSAAPTAAPERTSSTVAPGTTAAPTTAAASTTTAATTTTTTTVPEGFTVVSEDGDLMVEVPPGALAEDPGIAVGILAPEDYPEALAGAAQNPGTVVYSLEPDGLVFDAPVVVSRRIPASNFAGLPATGIPLITLLTTTPEGGFEQLASGTVIRDGDDVIVHGETFHFSELVAIYEQQYAEVDLGNHLGLATEVGTPLSAGISFHSADGSALEGPAEITPSGWTGDLVEIESSALHLDVDCTDVGEFRIGLRWDVELPVGDQAGSQQLGLSATPMLTGDNALPNLRLKLSGPIKCLDPDTAITGLDLTVDSKSDHSGDFEGKPSAVIAVISIDIGGGDLVVGLFLDRDGDGLVGPNDLMLSPVVVPPLDGVYNAVLPVDRYGDYMFYMGRADDFAPGIERELQTTVTVEDGATAVLGGLFRGDGRLESSVGIPYLGDIPLLHHLFSAEGGEGARDSELYPFITARIIDPSGLP